MMVWLQKLITEQLLMSDRYMSLMSIIDIGLQCKFPSLHLCLSKAVFKKIYRAGLLGYFLAHHDKLPVSQRTVHELKSIL